MLRRQHLTEVHTELSQNQFVGAVLVLVMVVLLNVLHENVVPGRKARHTALKIWDQMYMLTHRLLNTN